MPANSHSRPLQLVAMLLMLELMFLIFFGMHHFSGVSPVCYDYNSYLLQAQAWLRGQAHLDRNYEYLELAVYNGRYYVSFPPVPSIPMVLFTLIWGDAVPGALIQKLYVAIAALVILSELARSRRMGLPSCVAWAMFICLSSAMLPISLVGGVWYEAQILAFLFSASAIVALQRRRPTLSCFLYALSVGCRPFTVLLGPVLLAMQLRIHRRRGAAHAWKKLIPGVCVGLAVAACYGAYNYARFGNPFEFGHNHLPEFVRAEHGQFSLEYVGQNFQTLFFGSPFTTQYGRLEFWQFGFSMFLSNPILICLLVWVGQDLLHRRMNAVKAVILLAMTANTFLLLMHRTLGGHQFGARYALELVPMCFAYLLVSPHKQKLKIWECALLGLGFAFNFIGGCYVHI